MDRLGKTRHQRGFTLLELVIVLAVAGVLVAVVAPSMTGVSNRESLLAQAHTLAAKVAAAREAALEDGLCMAARLDGTTRLLWARMPERTCTAAVGGTGNTVTMSSGGGTGDVSDISSTAPPGLSHVLPAQQPYLSMTQAGELVWLPNGWLRGDNLSTPEGDVTDDQVIIRLTDSRLPTNIRTASVVVRATGLICVNGGGGTACP